MADKLNVLVICGSLRKGSYNAALTRALPKATLPPVSGVRPTRQWEFAMVRTSIMVPLWRE